MCGKVGLGSRDFSWCCPFPTPVLPIPITILPNSGTNSSPSLGMWWGPKRTLHLPIKFQFELWLHVFHTNSIFVSVVYGILKVGNYWPKSVLSTQTGRGSVGFYTGSFFCSRNPRNIGDWSWDLLPSKACALWATPSCSFIIFLLYPQNLYVCPMEVHNAYIHMTVLSI